MKKMAKIADRTWYIAALTGTIFLTFIVFLIIVNIICRRFFGKPIFGSTELVRYASLICGALALAMNEWFDGNIQMTLFTDHLPLKARQILSIVVYFICSGAFVFISYLLLSQTFRKYIKMDSTTDLIMPTFIFAGVLTIGFVILTICLAIKGILKIHEYRTGERLYGPKAKLD